MHSFDFTQKLAVSLIAIAALACIALAGCSTASVHKQSEPAQAEKAFLTVCSDKPMERKAEQAAPVPPSPAKVDEAAEADAPASDEPLVELEAEQGESYELCEPPAADYAGVYVADYSELYNSDGPTREMPGYHDGHFETYYSSNVMRHYRTDEWTVDEEGFYRDDQGRYVIGVDISESEQYPIGSEVETGKGAAVVMDYGSGALVHDFYTNW